jgi:formylglycine-generating enzyme required for sulfatase activity
MTPLFHQRILFALVLSLLIADRPLSQAQTIDNLKAGMVKITVTGVGQHRMGTGPIVKIEDDTAHIVIASPVVERSIIHADRVVPSDRGKSDGMTVAVPQEIPSKDGAPMVLVPAGEFTMGSPDGVGEKEEHPQHTVDLDAFYIDQYEVTTEQYAQFMSATGHSAPEFWDQVDSSRDGKKPVIGINWDDAQTYCDWAGKRLPTEAEWEKAARGTDQRTYPWGDTNPDSRIANFGKDWDSEVYAERLKAVGSYERGKSPYGAYDMVGNVSEWGADWYDKDYYGKSPQKNPHGPSSGVLKVLRGGSWLDSLTYLRSALRYWFNPAYRYANIGVRCAQDAP